MWTRLLNIASTLYISYITLNTNVESKHDLKKLQSTYLNYFNSYFLFFSNMLLEELAFCIDINPFFETFLKYQISLYNHSQTHMEC